MTEPAAEGSRGSGLSRRRLLGLGGAAAAVAGAGAVTGRATAGGVDRTTNPATVAFRGEHQAGIVTPAQDRLHFVSFDVTTDSRAELIELLREWTKAAERMTAGQEATENGGDRGRGPLAAGRHR